MKNLKIKSIAAILSVLICAVPISAEESHPTLTEQKVAAVLGSVHISTSTMRAKKTKAKKIISSLS